MDKLVFLSPVVAVGTIILVYLAASSLRSDRRSQRLHHYRNLHDEYRRVSNVIETIRAPEYLRTDLRHLSVAVEPFSVHVGEKEFGEINAIVRRNNPLIEPQTGNKTIRRGDSGKVITRERLLKLREFVALLQERFAPQFDAIKAKAATGTN